MQKRDFDYGTRYIAYVEKGDGSRVHYKSLGTFDTAVAAAVARARHRAARAAAAELAPPPASEAAAPQEAAAPTEETAVVDAEPPAPPPPPAAAAVAPAETLRAKVDRITASLELATDLSIMAGIREANALMGLAPDGLSLPEQADRLLAQIG